MSAIADAGAAADTLGYSIEPDAPIIIACVQRKLDVTSLNIWLWELDNREPTLNEFAGFLAKLAKKVQSNLVPLPVQSTSGVITRRAEPNAPHGFFKAKIGPSKGAVAKKAKIVCPRCEGGHLLHRCLQFRTLTLSAKVETVARARVCANCFAPSHATADCGFGACKRCDVKHNSLLCPRAQNNM